MVITPTAASLAFLGRCRRSYHRCIEGVRRTASGTGMSQLAVQPIQKRERLLLLRKLSYLGPFLAQQLGQGQDRLALGLKFDRSVGHRSGKTLKATSACFQPASLLVSVKRNRRLVPGRARAAVVKPRESTPCRCALLDRSGGCFGLFLQPLHAVPQRSQHPLGFLLGVWKTSRPFSRGTCSVSRRCRCKVTGRPRPGVPGPASETT